MEFEKMLERKLQPLVTSLDTLTKSVDSMSTKYDKVLQKVTVLEQANSKQLKINKDLEESNTKLSTEVTKLSEKLKVCKESLNNLEQYTRRECLEVSGIAELQDENTDELVIKVGSLMGVEINKEDISVSHRIPKPSFSSVAAGNWNNVEASTPKIIVKFTCRATRERFYVARKNLKDKTTGNLDLLLPSENKIYISENLTATNRELFKDCLKVKKDLNYRFIWTHHGRIFLRKDSGSPVIMVSNRSILDQVRQSTGEVTNVREMTVTTCYNATGS